MTQMYPAKRLFYDCGPCSTYTPGTRCPPTAAAGSRPGRCPSARLSAWASAPASRGTGRSSTTRPGDSSECPPRPRSGECRQTSPEVAMLTYDVHVVVAVAAANAVVVVVVFRCRCCYCCCCCCVFSSLSLAIKGVPEKKGKRDTVRTMTKGGVRDAGSQGGRVENRERDNQYQHTKTAPHQPGPNHDAHS